MAPQNSSRPPRDDLPGVSKPEVDVLLEEYKLHRQEVFVHIAEYNRQTRYIQLFGAVLVGFSAVFVREPDFLQKIPDSLRLFGLLLAALFAFYLVSAVMVSSYMFLVLRGRMSQIERFLNRRLAQPLFTYETTIAPRLLERAYLADGNLQPFWLSGVWRVTLFVGSLILLAYVAGQLLVPLWSTLYGLTIIYIGLYLMFRYAQLHGPEMRRALRRSRATLPARRIFISRTGVISLNYIVFVLVFMLVLSPIIFPQTSSRALDLILALEKESVVALILVYVALCAVFLPTPSEAVLFFMDSLAVTLVFTMAAIGKAIGSISLALIVSLFNYRFNMRGGQWVRRLERSSSLIERWNGRSPQLVYFVMQSVPFAPMRLSTIVFAMVSGLSRSMLLFWVGLASGVGTIIRMALMWLLVTLGAIVLPPIFGLGPS